MTGGSLGGWIAGQLDESWLIFANFDYVSTHLKHFSKCEAAISKLRAAFESLYALLKRARYCSIWTKLGTTAKEPDCYPSNLSVFQAKI